MEMNEYDRRHIVEIVENAGCRILRVEPTDHGSVRGGIVVAVR
jgi:hypothetical protein